MSTTATDPRRTQLSDIAAFALSVLGIVTSFPAFFLGAFFSLCALVVFIVARSGLSRPMTGWTRVALVLIVTGFLLQAAIALFLMPVTNSISTVTVVPAR